MNSYTDDELGSFGLRRDHLPRHVAIIMDGNGRWARQRDLERIEGHTRGADRVREITTECARLGIQQLTLYCLSSENWKRPPDELSFLMSLLQEFLISERPTLIENEIRLQAIGRIEELAPPALEELRSSIDMTSAHTGLVLCLALNYGGRTEIADACRRIVEAGPSAEAIDEETIAAHLDTAGMPDPDLVIRTANEMRVSNFLLWQISYSELWVTPKFWPDFDAETLRESLRDFAARERRFGGL